MNKEQDFNPSLNPQQDLLRVSLVTKREKGGILDANEIRYLEDLEKANSGAELSEEDRLTLLEVDQKASGRE